MVKTKKILIALAVIGANMLHTMPVYTSLAAEPDYTITDGIIVKNSLYSDGYAYSSTIFGNTELGTSALSGIEMVIRSGIYNALSVEGCVQMVGSNVAGANINNNSLTINDGTFDYYIYGVKYGGTDVESVISNNNTTLNDGKYNYGVYGVYAKNGKVKENTLTIGGGNI